MNFKDLLPICLGVLKDWRVIVITVLMILFIAIANYVVKYRKRVKPPKAKKAAVKAGDSGEKKEDGTASSEGSEASGKSK